MPIPSSSIRTIARPAEPCCRHRTLLSVRDAPHVVADTGPLSIRPTAPAQYTKLWARLPPAPSHLTPLYPLIQQCSRFRSASGRSCTTTPRSPALCCASFYAPFAPRSDVRAREPPPTRAVSRRFRAKGTGKSQTLSKRSPDAWYERATRVTVRVTPLFWDPRG